MSGRRPWDGRRARVEIPSRLAICRLATWLLAPCLRVARLRVARLRVARLRVARLRAALLRAARLRAVLPTARLVATALVVGFVATGCQGMDRVERPPEAAIPGDGEAGDAAGDRATRLRREGDISTLGEAGETPGRLTVAVATRRLAEIETVRGQERLDRIAGFVDAYPRAEGLSRLWVLAGEAQQDLERNDRAADAFERAVLLAGTDLLRLPHEPDLAYRVGWARFQAGDRRQGLDWLVRTTFISAHPRVEQALRFFRAEGSQRDAEARGGGDALGAGAGDFDAWLRRRRAELAVVAPDFELPGFQQDTVRSSELPGRVRVINFWTPT